jgi:hypothetical protein
MSAVLHARDLKIGRGRWRGTRYGRPRSTAAAASLLAKRRTMAERMSQ